jgi:hypothetical protein
VAYFKTVSRNPLEGKEKDKGKFWSKQLFNTGKNQNRYFTNYQSTGISRYNNVLGGVNIASHIKLHFNDNNKDQSGVVLNSGGGRLEFRPKFRLI